MKSRIITGLFFTTALLLSSCDFLDLSPDEEPTKKVTIKGTVAVPDGPSDVIVLSDTYHLGYRWSSCPESGNDSALIGGQFSLESTNNCSGAQYVYFRPDIPMDLKAYENGKIQFRLQTNNGNQQFTLVIQDASATSSMSVDLAGFGYDSSKVAVDQAISVPVTSLTVPGFDFSRVDRVFQLIVSCSTSDCFTTLEDIKWVPSDVLPALSSVEAGQAFSPMRLGRIPYCDPFPCRTVPRGNVGIMKPSTSGWKAEPSVPSVTTDSNGNFTLLVDAGLLSGDGPVYIAVSDANGSFTLLSTIPDDLIRESATIELPVDRTTTAVGMMTCANGITIPTDGSGGWCIGDPISSSELEAIYPTVTEALNTTISVDVEVFMPDVLDDPAVIAAVNKLLSDNGEATVTVDVILQFTENNTFPIVTPRGTTATGTNNDGTNDPGGLNSQCQLAVTCDVCSVNACVSTGTDAASCKAGYQTSDGRYFACTSCSDCTAAATAATNYCCPTP